MHGSISTRKVLSLTYLSDAAQSYQNRREAHNEGEEFPAAPQLLGEHVGDGGDEALHAAELRAKSSYS